MAKTIQRSMTIDSTPERVWKVLTDFPTHSDRNPFIREIRRDVAVGARLDVQIAPEGSSSLGGLL